MSGKPLWIRAGGKRLEARRIDPPEAVERAAARGDPEREVPTLVFLHEGLGCVGLWRDFPEQLARQTGCGAFVYSRAGYGASDPCPLPRPLDYLEREALEVLPEVLDEVGCREYFLVGHSDGASIALAYAGHAERPGLLGLISEAAHVFNEEICVRAAERVREQYTAGDLRDRLARHHGDNVDTAFYGWNDAWLDPGFLAMNLERYLGGVGVPCLVMQGEDDEYGTLAQVDAIAAGVSGPVETWAIPDCGHAPHRDQGGAVLDAMTRFIETHRR